MPRVSEARLHTASDIRKALARVWREVERDRMDLKKARTLGYLGQVMLGVIQASDLETRIQRLEGQVRYELPEKFKDDAAWEAAGDVHGAREAAPAAPAPPAESET